MLAGSSGGCGRHRQEGSLDQLMRRAFSAYDERQEHETPTIGSD
jgi:hypothetical protein